METIEFDLYEDARLAAGTGVENRRSHAEVKAGLLLASWKKVRPVGQRNDIPTIGVLGGPAVIQAMATILGQKAHVQPFARGEDVVPCEVLFISKAWLGFPEDVLAKVGNSPTLTVSDAEGFCAAGGMIEFYVERVQGDDRMRFMICPRKMAAAGINGGDLLPGAPKIFKD